MKPRVHPSPPTTDWSQRLAFASALLVALAGATVLTGWWLGVERLVCGAGHLEPVKANAAFGYLCLGLAVAAQARGARSFSWLVATSPAAPAKAAATTSRSTSSRSRPNTVHLVIDPFW